MTSLKFNITDELYKLTETEEINWYCLNNPKTKVAVWMEVQ